MYNVPFFDIIQGTNIQIVAILSERKVNCFVYVGGNALIKSDKKLILKIKLTEKLFEIHKKRLVFWF